MPRQCPANDERQTRVTPAFLRHWRGIGGALNLPKNGGAGWGTHSPPAPAHSHATPTVRPSSTLGRVDHFLRGVLRVHLGGLDVHRNPALALQPADVVPALDVVDGGPGAEGAAGRP